MPRKLTPLSGRARNFKDKTQINSPILVSQWYALTSMLIYISLKQRKYTILYLIYIILLFLYYIFNY